MRAFPQQSAPPTPLARTGLRAGIHPRAARRLARSVAASSLAVLVVLVTATGAIAAGPPAAIVATGLTEPSGVIVDPNGDAWDTDANGLCKIDSVTGTVGATCVAGAGGAAFYDPTPLSPGSGDEVVLVGSGAVNATTVSRYVWDGGAGTFDPDGTIDVGLARVQAVAIDSSGNGYAIGARNPVVKRIDGVTAADPAVDTVGNTAGVRGGGAIAAGKDAANNTTIYIAENVGGGISALHPGSASTTASLTAFGNAGEVFGGLAWDEATGVLYGGSANLAIADQFIDTIESFPVRPAGAQNLSLATGLAGVGGLTVKPDGTLLAVDDPSGNGDPGAGRMLATGLPAVVIGDGPAAVTKNATPTFTFTASEGAQCKISPPASATFAICTSPFTSAPLADGTYTFSVRPVAADGTTGFPITRRFTVDTTPPVVTIDGPAEGAVAATSVVIRFHTSEQAAASCRLDTGSFVPCGSGTAIGGIAPGGHTIDVLATDAAGNTSAVASVHFTVPAGAGPAGVPPGTPATQVPGVGGMAVAGAKADRTAPALRLALRGGRARLRGTAIALPFRCSEACEAEAHGTVSVRGSARLYRLRGASAVLHGGRAGTLVVHVPRSALGAIRRALRSGRAVSLQLSLRAEDVAGNARTRAVRVRLGAR
jgi:hypothetical protein